MARKHQFKAGYVLESVQRWMKQQLSGQDREPEMYSGLMNLLTTFEASSDIDLNELKKENDPIFFVLYNLVIRGMPTWISWELEKEIARKIKLLKPYMHLGAEGFEFSGGDYWKDLLLRALHIIEPRIDRNTACENYLNSWEEHGSTFEERYLYEEVPKWIDNNQGDLFIQLLEPQRSIENMVTVRKDLKQHRNNFFHQRADFVIEFPYLLREQGKKGICIEIDGSQHIEDSQKQLDNFRDDALYESNWAKTLRLKTENFDDAGFRNHFAFGDQLLQTEYFTTLKNNYCNPLFHDTEGLTALELMLSPLAIARIQLALIRMILSGGLSFEKEAWNIAVIERDVPCANLAISDLKKFIKSLFKLEGKGRKLPVINLKVYVTEEFASASLSQNEDKFLVDGLESDGQFYDLYIDISMLERHGLSRRKIELNFDHYVQIRSSYSVQVEPEFLTSNRINWRPLFNNANNNQREPVEDAIDALRFFLNNVFRKIDFRPGQLPILNRALQNKTVIGLLPTGGGKSLTYQLAGLLQPGHTIIIDPIKSLMKDQVDGLARMGITGTMYINSSLKTFEEKELAMQKFRTGQAIFCFISPERLMIPSFRGILEKMAKEKRYFSYGVIDEVHCVSEWGHDFRTPYLSLGRNMLDFCKPANGEIALFGLTATASYDVLSDVQRELSGSRVDRSIPDEAIIRHETTNRDELQMSVSNISLSENIIDEIKSRAGEGKFGIELKKMIGQLKQSRINELLEAAPDLLRGFNNHCNEIVTEDLINLTYESNQPPTVEEICSSVKLDNGVLTNHFWDGDTCVNAGLVFAPHRSWYFGVTDKYKEVDWRNFGIYEYITQQSEVPFKAGTFIGVDNEDEDLSKKIEDDNFRNQENFLENELNLMVSTKAFGMGIDKSNIRFTVHSSYPSSIESYIQEAGRAGRDHKLAVSTIVFNDQSIEDRDNPGKYIDNDYDIQLDFYNNSFKGEEKEKAVIYEILTEVTHPKRKKTYDLALKLNEDPDAQNSGIVFSINFSEVYGTMFLNDKDGNNYGYIRTRSGEVVLNNINVDRLIAEKYLDKLWNIIRDLSPADDYTTIKNWLSEEKPVDPTPGIERLLEERKYGDKYALVVPFRNDESKVFHRLAGKLKEIDSRIKPEHCRDYFNPDADEFLKAVFKNLNIVEYGEKIKEHFNQDNQLIEDFYKKLIYSLNTKRDKSDTEKAIYRLSLIGVIDDYTIDYNAETYTLKGTRKTNEQYHEHLRIYINKYYSNRRTESIINGLPDRKGDTEIQRILNFTIGFIYQEVAKKRKEAIKAMKTCCQVGLRDGNVEMKTWIHLYFNSKYARKDYQIEVTDKYLDQFRTLPSKEVEGEKGVYNASLLDWSDEGRESDFNWVIDFILITVHDSNNSQRDNLKHLRGACTRMLIPNPDNFVFKLLRAYSLIVLEEDYFGESQIKLASEDLESGFLNLWNYLESDQTIFYRLLTEFQQHVEAQLTNPIVVEGFRDHLEKILFLSHIRWTENFSNEFTKNLIE